jgi:hypothetical protein
MKIFVPTLGLATGEREGLLGVHANSSRLGRVGRFSGSSAFRNPRAGRTTLVPSAR